ncbi:hypothetical protein P170DRAFT_433326 [Aspergillus steynii IBT 23096]|uniref:Uncharacterized protein n=1 Tax=Aspergillus steynii IBT 23096 TaxID=1392250 RepID=A0A2I2GSK5_9EURO|nr:uncharacterized protein P170DRAFT_433326 [Aspergillus steynii IBT 23096]PLB55857.1 hypothetical protein P170DRAFT_433326 [Aspergillus steynii IBT 23096]
MEEIGPILDQLRKLEDPAGGDCMIDSNSSTLDDVIFIRSNTLDEWNGKRASQNIEPHSILAHGGRISADIRTIQMFKSIESSNTERVIAWIEAFEKYYGVPFGLIERCIFYTPQQILRVMDRRASVHAMKVWNKPCNKERGQRIVDNCNAAIQMWKEDAKSMLVLGSSARALLDKIDEDWCVGFSLTDHSDDV